MRPKFSFSSRKTRTIDTHNQHRKPFPALATEVIRISDIVLYVLDARYIEETRNRDLEEVMRKNEKLVITILNKSDLVDISKIDKREITDLKPYIFLSCKEFSGIKRLKEKIKIEIKRLRSKKAIFTENLPEEDPDALKGHKRVVGMTQWLKLTKKAHVGVVGYPNTGKSSLINVLTNRSVSRASPQSGFTKGIQKIRFDKDTLILDTPGVIEKDSAEEEKKDRLARHIKIGARTHSHVKDPQLIVTNLFKDYSGEIESYYKIKSEGDIEKFFELLGRERGFLAKGNIVDEDRTARLVLKDWQSGAIARKKKE